MPSSSRIGSRFKRVTLTTVLSLAAATACDMSGTTVQAANEWDQDVTVVIRGLPDRTALRVPAGTRGTVENEFASPSDDARVIVLDESCEQIASLALPAGESTVYIGVDGDVTVETGDGRPTGLPQATLAEGPCS